MVTAFSNDGAIVLKKFTQVPSEHSAQFRNVIQLLGLEMWILNRDGKLAMRGIIEKETPSLLENFDYHFGMSHYRK